MVPSIQQERKRSGKLLMRGLKHSLVLAKMRVHAIGTRLSRRLQRAVFTWPSRVGWIDTVIVTLLYGCIALVVGFASGLVNPPIPSEISRELFAPKALVAALLPDHFWTFAGISFLLPALAEELVFRVLWVPRREERSPRWRKWAWAALALGAFVLWHPLNARFFLTDAQSVFTQPSFLGLAALLGLACTVLYQRTGSVWSPVVFHWLVGVGWKLLGGFAWLESLGR